MVLLLLLHAALFAGALGSPPVGCLDTPPPAACEPLLRAVGAAYAKERNHWVVDTYTDPFYQAPPNVSAYRPGDLIRLDHPGKDLQARYKIPAGLKLHRMLYQSADMDNRTVPASAFILLPYARPWRPLPLIAWAHGTCGMARPCAPSSQTDLYYQYEAPYAMALQGFAVVAPDYAGLGANGSTFAYLAGPAHAADVVHAVAAARAALPAAIPPQWVVIGHSEGGLTAWATNERAPAPPGFLGAVAIAPALANLRIVRANVARTGGALGNTLLYPAYTLAAIARRDAAVDPARYFSAAGAERAALAARGCTLAGRAAFAGLSFADAFRDASWLNASFANAWEARAGVDGTRALAKPMLVIAGLSDAAVPPEIIEDIVDTQCSAHRGAARVRLSRYPGVDHEGVTYVSQLEYLSWVIDLFDGVAPETCERSTVEFAVQRKQVPMRFGG